MLTEKQVAFLNKEFGILNFEPEQMRPEKLWQLSEDCFGIECDEERTKAERDAGLELFHALQKLLPDEWKFKTPPEVEAMLAKQSESA